MDSGGIRERLERSLAERPLSRAERQALAESFAALVRDELRGEARRVAFELVRTRDDTIPRDELLDWLEEVMKALLRPTEPRAAEAVAEAWFSPVQNCAGRIVQLLNSAAKTLDICVFTVTDDRISDAIHDAHRRRVAVRVITDGDKSIDLGSDVERLRSCGVPVRVDRSEFHMHHKFALFDGARVLTGSYNWTRGAARDNEENFIVTSDLKLVGAFGKTFERLWARLE
jgi:phosphatidylserine/phosphatidylglycerophosphate/cardiolipin synthase-like enzyme